MRTPLLAALAVTALASTLPAQQTVDILIRGGRVIDGTGTPERVTDIGVRGDRIVFIGDATAGRVTGTRTIDATGLVVAPGFIDPHTHSEGDLSGPNRGMAHILLQGVTTIVNGNDGSSSLDLAQQFGAWQQAGIGVNAASFVGQGSVRSRVLGSLAIAPTAVQLDSMRALVATAMRAGAVGMSTGLYYAPGSFATTEEVIELAKVASAAGGIYDTHMRDESSYTIGLLGSIEETIRIAREAKIPVHISHIKALGVDVWGKSVDVIALVKKAQAEGLKVTASQYPYTASGTGVSAALMPRWAEAGGNDSMRARLADPATRAKIVTEMEDNLRRRNGPDAMLMISGDTSVRGKTLAQIAAQRRLGPVETAIQMITGGQNSSVASFNMNEEDIERFMKEPWVVTGSDGSGGHPRKYGTFPRKIREYVYWRKVISLPFAVRQSSAVTAEIFGFTGRGVLKTGNFADIIAFEPSQVTDRSTYTDPTIMAGGMKYVLVNGVVAVNEGQPTGTNAGRVLRGPGAR